MNPIYSISKFIVKRPKIVFILFTFFTLLVGSQALNVYMISDLSIYLPSGEPVINLLNRIQEYWPVGSSIIIFVEASDVTDYNVLKEMLEVEDQVNKYKRDNGNVDGVISTSSIASLIRNLNSKQWPYGRGENKLPKDRRLIDKYIAQIGESRWSFITSDKKDAAMIALYGQSENPDLWQPDEVQVMQLQQMHTAVEGLQKQSTMLKNQLEAFSQLPVKEKNVMGTLKALLKTIKAKIAKLEDKMLEIANNYYRDTFFLLQTIPGIGPKTAIVLITITNNFKKFDDTKKLSAYVGLSPRVYQSGTSINGKGHITKMGNKYVRKLLYLCAWSAKQHNEQCKVMYDRLKEKKKPERVIKIAIANKLLRQAFAIATNCRVYDKNYEYKFGF